MDRYWSTGRGLGTTTAWSLTLAAGSALGFWIGCVCSGSLLLCFPLSYSSSGVLFNRNPRGVQVEGLKPGSERYRVSMGGTEPESGTGETEINVIICRGLSGSIKQNMMWEEPEDSAENSLFGPEVHF